MIGFARLDARTIEDVEKDVNATGQALIVVVLAVVASAIGTLGGDRGVVEAILLGAISAVLGWIVFSVIAYFVGSTLFATAQTSVTIGQTLRVVGFAQTPKLLAILGFIPVIGWVAWILAYIWFVVVAIVAIRQAFEFSTERAVGTAIVALIVNVVVDLIIALIIGIPIWIMRSIT
ncbi:MAG: YIP1 family protein [Chloroflexota bacterium]|nr:YIP1 family protein [Chloroflexota bacterium]